MNVLSSYKKENIKSIDIIKNNLIDKILTIINQDFITALDKLIDSSYTTTSVEISEEQKLMLLMSEEDIKAGRLISQD